MAPLAPHTLAEPSVDGLWLRPGQGEPAEPVWGHADGIQVGLAPLPGPRGLLRIYTPYLDHPRHRMVNYLAVEPIVAGDTQRGFSELERSELDSRPGKRFWSTDDPADPTPVEPELPTRGVIDEVDGVERLTLYVGVERFDSGADVFVRVRFRADRPHEVAVAGFDRECSAPLRALVLTATMGNYARLRALRLRERIVTPAQLWPDFSGTAFTEHARFPLDELERDGRAALVTATTDEVDPASAMYSDDTKDHWHYQGSTAVQGWRVDDPHDDLEVLVNGRWAYWASESPIPGGPSFENFEVVEPFRPGAEYRFSVEPSD